MPFTPHRPAWRLGRDILLLAAAYVLTGRLALLLAIPPGYAMAVYPPAGIALGIVLIGGYALAPGVALGSFMLNLWIGWETKGAIGAGDLLVPAVVGIGAALQALCGAWLVRRFVGYPSALDKEWQILLFLVLSGPVASLVNASIGVGMLFHSGIIGAADVLSNWATWWVGDTLGVLVVTPLLLIALGEPRNIWRSRRFNVGIPLLVSLAIVIIAFVFVRDMEQKRLVREFREDAGGMVRMLQTRLNFHSEMVKILERHFASSQTVSREDFRTFVSSVLARYPTLHGLEWAPRIAREERGRFEDALRKQKTPDSGITELTPEHRLVRAAEREEYFPVYYVEPFDLNARALGFDLASTPRRRAALEKARDTGLTIASEPLNLLQPGKQPKESGGLLFMAVYEKGAVLNTVEQRRKAFRGVVVSIVRIGDLTRLVFSEEQLRQIRFHIFDADAPAETASLYNTLEPGARGVPLQAKLSFGERAYTFIAQPSPRYWETHRSWAAWWMLVGGLFFTNLLGMYLLIMSAQAYKVDALVKERTRQLQESKNKLKENAALLQAVMDSMSSCVYVRDSEGRFLYVNKKYEQVFAKQRHDVIGRTLGEVYPEESAAQYRNEEQLVMQEGKAMQMEIVLPQEDGLHTYLVVRSPLFTGDGKVSGICGVAIDITQNKQTEINIRHLNRQLEATTSLQKAILNSANFSIISTDVNGIIQVFNVGAQRMLGYSSAEMVGKRTPEIIHDRGEVEERAAILSHELGYAVKPGFEVFVARARSSAADEREWTYIRKDGSRLPVMLSVTALWNERNELTGFLGVAYDLTERKKIESMKSEFISTVSHELRTPLTSIHGALDLLTAGVAGDIQPEIKTLIDIANEDCNRLVRLVSDILDSEKIASGNMRFEMVVQHLRPLIEQAISATQPYADRYQVLFALQPGGDCLVAADADRIIQVLVNLLSNAAKYSHPDSVVHIRLTDLRDRVRVSVIDQGEGVPEEFRDRIFQKFAQADGSDTRKKGGTGLGLSICKSIIEKHRGHIDFHSTPGAGSEFYFELPAATLATLATRQAAADAAMENRKETAS